MKRCCIPGCNNNSQTHQDKIFLHIQRFADKIYNKWVEITKPEEKESMVGWQYCCEDHFDLENDVENWMYYKTMGSRLKLKKDFNFKVPRIVPSTSQLTTQDRRRKAVVLEQWEKEKNPDALDVLIPFLCSK